MDLKEAWTNTSKKEVRPLARPSINWAIEWGDKSLFESLLEENCAVDVADDGGWWPLHNAAFNGHLSMVKRLLQHEDIEIDFGTSSRGETALSLAAEQGHSQVCKCLLQNGAQPNIGNNRKQSPLHIAVREGHFEGARLLVEFGADVNAVNDDGTTPLLHAAKLGMTDMVDLLVESGARVDAADSTGITPLIAATRSGNRQCLLLMRKMCRHDGHANVDVEDEDGETPLMIAAKRGRLDCVRYLLDKGADASQSSEYGWLAIGLAIEEGHLDCVKALLPRTSQYALLKACYGDQVTTDPDWLTDFLDGVRSNGPLNLPADGYSILDTAVEWGRLDILRYLLESGIHPDHYIATLSNDVYIYCDYIFVGETALGSACHKGSWEMVTLLLDHGAQFNLGNDLICNPLHCALRKRCPTDFIHFLLSRGADINGHAKNGNDVPPAMRDAFVDPHMLHRLLVLGVRFTNWDHTVFGGVGHMLAQMARSQRQHIGDVLVKVLRVLVHFAPLHRFRPLCSTLKSICSANPVGSLAGWNRLDEELASPERLRQLCRLKTREVMMMRKGFRLESDVSTLQLPQSLREYLMFR